MPDTSQAVPTAPSGLTPTAYGLLDPLQYGSFFEPDKPISRLEAVVITMGLLGRRYQAENLSGQGAPDNRRRPASRLGKGMDRASSCGRGGQGVPDGSFKGGQAVTRAEAVTMVERALDAMTRGIDPDLRLTVNGETVSTPAPLAIRDGYVCAPAGAIYGGLANTEALCSSDSILRVFPGNGRYKYALARLLFPVGAPFALACTRGTRDSRGSGSGRWHLPLRQRKA